ncbi:MAG: hypothetical protein ACRDVM_02025 [Acidimicrobiia bacterium]
MRYLLGLFALSLVAACGGPETAGVTVVASSPGAVGTGDQRLLLGLVSDEAESLAAPDRPVTAELIDPDGEPAGETAGEFIWTIPDVRGLYVTHFDFDRAGTWIVRLLPDGLPPTPPSPFQVAQDPSVPEVGEPAPPSDTRTAADYPLEEISSDPEPDSAFYRLSLAEAFTSGRATVVVFATPAFCTSQTCGPTLDHTKTVAARHPDVNFVHVEVFENLDAAGMDQLRPVPAVVEWGLPSEPWVFVVDAAGEVAARFEGAFSEAELERALEAIGA